MTGFTRPPPPLQSQGTGPRNDPPPRRQTADANPGHDEGATGLGGRAERQNPLAELFATEYRRQGTAEGCAAEGCATEKRGQERAQERRSLKKSSMSRAHSSARTPAYTSGAGATRPSRSTS